MAEQVGEVWTPASSKARRLLVLEVRVTRDEYVVVPRQRTLGPPQKNRIPRLVRGENPADSMTRALARRKTTSPDW